MPSIHLIKNNPDLPGIDPINPGSTTHRSGYWAVSPEIANALVGGEIFFHEAQVAPAFIGGTIICAEVQADGPYAGRIVFTFEADPFFVGVEAGPEGWNREKKILL